jgi:signal transduction histidine kinase
MPVRTRTFGLNSLGFLSVTLAAYLSAVVTMGYVLNSIGRFRAVVLIFLAVALSGKRSRRLRMGQERQRSQARDHLSRAADRHRRHAAVPGEIAGNHVCNVAAGRPGRGVDVPTRDVCCLRRDVAAPRRPMTIFIGWRPALVLGVFFLAGIVFVVVITELAVKEQRANREVERLVTELQSANDKLRQYADQVEELATLKERNRLAREIHDSLGHYLTVVIVQIEAAMALIEKDRERSLDGLRKAQGLAQKGLAEVRESVAVLRAPRTEAGSLIESLNNLFEECRVSGLAAEFRLIGTPRALSASAELALYRAAQEGLTNVRKHAQAQAATVTLDYAAEAVWLRVHDAGIGATEPKKGFGLVGMHERVTHLGGELRIATAANEGFTLEVGLPG